MVLTTEYKTMYIMETFYSPQPRTELPAGRGAARPRWRGRRPVPPPAGLPGRRPRLRDRGGRARARQVRPPHPQGRLPGLQEVRGAAPRAGGQVGAGH